MSTRHVILGLLREQPGHTYDVAVRFGRRLEPWQMNRGQVYRMMTALESDGLIEKIGVQAENVRSGPPWKLTAAGTEELERWFATRSEEVEPLRGELLAKFAVAEPADAAQLLIALDWYERALIAEIAADVHKQHERSAAGADEWSDQIADCIADAAMLHRDAELIWVRRVRDVVHSWSELGGDIDRLDDRRIARGG